MKLGILSFVLDSFSVKRLRQAALKRSHTLKLLDANFASLHCCRSDLKVFLNSRLAPDLDLLLPRLGAASSSVGLSIVRQFELSGTTCINSSGAIAFARDKLLTMQLLANAGIEVPASALAVQSSDIGAVVERLGGPPVIVKVTRGTQGIGVMLAESVKAAEAIFETMQMDQRPVLIQKFIAESRGRDIRAFVVGDKVIAAMRRVARGDEFRSNYHRGGRVEPVKLETSFEQTALKAASVLGLDIAGVDILEGRDGPLIMELNSSPGLEGIETASNKDVAGAIVELAERRVQIEEVRS